MNTEKSPLRMSPQLKALLKEQAAERGMSLSAYMRMILTERAAQVSREKVSK